MKKSFTSPRAIMALLAVVGLFLASQFGYAASTDDLMLGGLALAGIGEIELKDINALLTEQGRTFEEFKKANDDRLKAIEAKGYAPADLTEKVDRMLADMAKMDKEVLEIQKKGNRLNPGDSTLTEEQAEHKDAFLKYLRKGVDNGLGDLQKKAMSNSSDPDGGYLVLPEMDSMIDRVVPTISGMYRLANVVTIGSAKWEKRVKTSGLSMRRPGEGAGGGETTNPKYAKISIEVWPAEVEPWVENSTLEDADIDLAMDLADEAAIGFGEGAGAEFITGNGVGTAHGILSYTNVANASYAWGKLGYIASGAAGDFAASNPGDKLIALQHALKSQYRNGAAWLMSDATLGTARQMKDGSGAFYLWQPDTAGAFGGRLLGAPVEIDDNMSAIAANSYSIAFGNFARGYTIVNRRGTVLIRDNLTTKGVTKFNFTRRFGGGIHNFEAIKLMRFATS